MRRGRCAWRVPARRPDWGAWGAQKATFEAKRKPGPKDESGEDPAPPRRVPETVRAGPLAAPKEVLVRGATVWTSGPEGILEDADLLVRDGKVAKVGRGLKARSDAFVVEGAGRHVTAGLIDCHSHIAVSGDVNEFSEACTADVRIRDVVDPDAVASYQQLAGGLTCAHLLHGSANPIGGQSAVIKFRWGADARGLLFAGAPGGIKFALGENPKGQENRFPTSRMGVEQAIRGRLQAAAVRLREAKDYEALSRSEKKRRLPPKPDLELAALAACLEGHRKVHCHAYRADEMLMLIRLAEESRFRIGTFQHVLEGYKIADAIAARQGTTFSDWWLTSSRCTTIPLAAPCCARQA